MYVEFLHSIPMLSIFSIYPWTYPAINMNIDATELEIIAPAMVSVLLYSGIK